jgi:hypothetical protein
VTAGEFFALSVWGVMIIAIGTICGTLLHDWFDL